MINQSGNHNKVKVTQHIDDGSIAINQQGDGNNININQHEHKFLEINQYN